MSAKPDLLPLPDVKRWRAMKDRNGNVGYSDKPDPKYSESAGTDSLTWVRLNDHTAVMRAYARANVAHATAARDAEIERLKGVVRGMANEIIDKQAELQREVEGLRAEVERWKSLHATAYEAFRTGVATERRLEARAGRLAEALRVAVESDLGALWVWPDSAREQWMKDARAALDQETTNG